MGTIYVGSGLGSAWKNSVSYPSSTGTVKTAGVTGPGLGMIGTPAQLRAGELAPRKRGAGNNMKISSIPKSGRKGSVVYVNTLHGKVVREYVRPRNPQTTDQQGNRSNFGAVRIAGAHI